MARFATRSHVVRTLALAAVLETCAPIVGGPSAVTPVEAPAVHAASSAPSSPSPPLLPREHVEGLSCPVAFADADVLLARIGDTQITACDVALAEQHDRRDGIAPRDARTILRALVDEAMLAAEARVRELDHDPSAQRIVREALASAVVHAEARHALVSSLPDDEAMRAYYENHRDDFTLDERVRLREIVALTEAEARAILHDAAETPFETLVARTHSTDGERDQGDLGLVPRGGNDRVSAAIATAGFALTEPGTFVPDPIRVERMVPVGRHHRLQREVAWHVIQFMGTTPSHTLDFDEARALIRHRLAFGREQQARMTARAQLLEHARQSSPVRVDVHALARIHLQRPPMVTTERHATHR